MDWQSRMNSAVGYIEANLTGEISPAAAARIAGCSEWEFLRLFSFLAHVSLGEYIRGRRLTLAGYELQNTGEKVIDIAMKYGYDSAAAFSRAFSQMHGCSPSSARSEGAALKPYPRAAFKSDSEGANDGMEKKMENGSDLRRFFERGYYVKENMPVYYTRDMDKTCEWFRSVLGWSADVAARDENGKGSYGCVSDIPMEMIMTASMKSAGGFHFFAGEPSKGVAGFIMVDNVEKFRQYVLGNGWDQITEIYPQDWGARECAVTTVDGSVLRVCQITE